MQNLPEIVNKLLEQGRSPDTPVAIIKEGTRPEQETVVSSLKDISNKVKEYGLGPPAVIVIGEVVSLRENLRWFDNRPLFGKRILVTRARHQASALSRLLYERGAQPVELPAIDIQPAPDKKELDQAIRELDRYQWLAFTSVNGVVEFFKRLHSLKLDTRALKGIKIGAIGPATAKALEARGIVPDYLPEVYTSQGFVAGLKVRGISGERFLLPRADIADKELTRGLRDLGAEVREVTVYRTVPATGALAKAREMLVSGRIDVITFTSSSTVSNLMAIFRDEQALPDSIKIACIGPKTVGTVQEAGLKVDITAREHTIPDLVAAIEAYFRKEI
jgi:uroporphyrinogen III methyltransferase/synthase